MDPRNNPYAPGAGSLPPALAGRDEIVEKINIQLDRCLAGMPARSFLIVGLRGVGKTVLLNHIAIEAESRNFAVISIETPEKRSLPALIIPSLRSALIKLSRKASVGAATKRALKALGSFVKVMKVKYKDLEIGFDLASEEGLADSGDLENDLIELFCELGRAAKENKTALILFIDEIQYIKEDEFASLIMALHKCVQLQLPVAIVGAGLPQLVGQAGRAKSYAERLFEYPEIGPLTEEASNKALEEPAARQNIHFTSEALREIYLKTKAYPYFIQEWGKHCWQAANQSPITLEDVMFATESARVDLDANFFRVRLDRLTPSEKIYLRAMAELGAGPHRSGDIAEILKKEVQSLAPTRAALIKKGMIYSPHHGDNSFTVPLFNEYLKRVILNK
jgi:Cdc6-like AAA superfamily ATPase